MPVSRMRMRQWMEMKIESKSIPGLAWVDKEKTMFTIPWKHAARHGWELDKDASLFKQWAIHTGKYVEGQTSDPKTWKANFRCAMNSLPDIEEVKDRSINKGHAAMRFFRMLPATPKSRDKQSRAKEAKSRKKIPVVKLEEDTDYSDAHSPIDESTREETLSTQENTVDSTVHSTEQQDFTTVIPCEVPDWSNAVEIGTDFSNFSYRFEVSPEHSPDFATDEIVEICQMLERETQWITHPVDGTGLLSNEPCTSPGSQWSESSSVDELDEAPHYTTLGIEFPNPMEDLWSNFDQSIPL